MAVPVKRRGGAEKGVIVYIVTRVAALLGDVRSTDNNPPKTMYSVCYTVISSIIQNGIRLKRTLCLIISTAIVFAVRLQSLCVTPSYWPRQPRVSKFNRSGFERQRFTRFVLRLECDLHFDRFGTCFRPVFHITNTYKKKKIWKMPSNIRTVKQFLRSSSVSINSKLLSVRLSLSVILRPYQPIPVTTYRQYVFYSFSVYKLAFLYSVYTVNQICRLYWKKTIILQNVVKKPLFVAKGNRMRVRLKRYFVETPVWGGGLVNQREIANI